MSDQKDINFNFGFVDCPMCSHKMDAIHKVYDIPYFGETIIFTLKCTHCGYKTSDLYSVREKEGKRYTLKFNNVNQLKHKVIRSSSCSIKIPELGIEIEPSFAAEGYITNVEGILLGMKDVITGLLLDLKSEEEINNANQIMQNIDCCCDGKFNFTLIIEDKNGNSAIVPEFEDASLEEESLK